MKPTGEDRILRYEVPVDDDWHKLQLFGDIVHVDARTPYTVEVWAWHHGPSMLPVNRDFRVFATGQPITTPRNLGYLHHRGTVIVAGGRLVWHLIERTAL